jgi:hypothetical protein
MTEEERRLDEVRENGAHWKKWGPYLSERQWGTVREDYSENGDAWNYFTHNQARSRDYHWGEDGLAGLSDDHQLLCFSIALWNGNDPILKERLFGLTNRKAIRRGRKDATSISQYADTLIHEIFMQYPQSAYLYSDLVETNRRSGRNDLEYELLDTGVFDDDRYFDVFVEYAKASPDDVLIKISSCNRGPKAATLHVLATLWFRNTWIWWPDQPKPVVRVASEGDGLGAIAASHVELGERVLYCEGKPNLLFTEDETNSERVFLTPNQASYVKDGINDHVVGKAGGNQPGSDGNQGRRALPGGCRRGCDS